MTAFGRFLCVICLPFLAGASLTGIAPQAAAQVAATQGVYTLNQERLFSESLFGIRVVREVEKRSSVIANENRDKEQELKIEEARLTEQRPSLKPAEFRNLADEFDKKVEAIRTGQARKSRDVGTWADAEHKRFFTAAFPVLLTLAQDIGASVIIDQRSAIISSNQADITDKAIKRMNDTIGDGTKKPKE